MANIAVFASGNGSNFEVLAEYFKNDKENSVKLLICNKKKAFVIERANKFEIDTKLVNYVKDGVEGAEKSILEHLINYKIDVVFLAGYMKMISKNLLDETEIPIINIHPSLLPNFKGAHAIEQAFNSVDSESGISIHYVNEEMDSGEIIFQKAITINREKGIERFEEEIHKLEHEYYPLIARDICDSINKSS